MGQARDEAGNIWETDAQGNAVRLVQAAGASQMPADPSFQYEGPKAAADAASAGAGAQVDAATVQAQIDKAVADALRAQRAGKTEGLSEGLMWDDTGNAAVPIPGYKPKQSDAQAAAADKKEGQSRKADVVRDIMGEVRGLFNSSIKGQPLSRAFGATEYIDGLPANEEFRIASENILPLIRPMIASTAKEGDSDKEMQIFMSFIPSNNDSDRTVERKLKQLEMLIGGLVDGVPPSRAQATLEGAGGDDREQAAQPFLPGGDGGPRVTTGAGGAPAMQAATGDRYTTPQDLALAQAVEQVYRGGGSVQDMLAAVAQAGGDPKMEDVAAWQQAVDFRDGAGAYEGRPAGFSDVTPGRSGVRNLAEQVWGDVGASGPGTFAINAADQWAGGGGLDEITGAINSTLKGTDYDAETAYANFGKQAVSAENPGWALTGSLAGGVSQGYGLGRTLPAFAKALTQTAPRIIASGGIYGGLGGALESNNDRVGGAAVGTGIGVAGGLFGGYAAAPAMDAISRSGIGRKLFRTNAPEFNPGERALPAGDVMTSARINMEDAARLGLPYSIADSDPKMRMLAGSVARKSPNARQMAENTFEPRARGQAERAYDAVDAHLAPITDIAERGQQWRKAAQTASSPHYATGRQRAAPVDPRVAAYLGTDTGREALKNARRIAQNEGRDPNAMGFDLDDQGEVVIRNLPSWETLDYVKRGIDQQLEPFRNPLTGKLDTEGNPMAGSLDKFRRDFLNTLDELNPDYAAARGAYAEQIRNRDALERGAKAIGPQVKPRDVPRITGAFDDTQMGEFRRGYATRAADQVNDTSITGNPYERVYGTPARQEKIDTIFPEGSANFNRIYGLERDMAKTAQETLGGSPTASRLAADQLFDSPVGMALDAGTQIATGGGFSPATALRVGAKMVGDNWKLGFGQKKADALAPVLFNTNPQQAMDYLSELAIRQNADQARKSAFRRQGGLFGSLLPVAGALAVPNS